MSETKRRKVLFTSGMSPDSMLIITDAPKEEIEKWCYTYNSILEDGLSPNAMKSVCDPYYVRVIHDSEFETGNENINAIGYDECYDWTDYYLEDTDDCAAIVQAMKDVNMSHHDISLAMAEIKRLRKLSSN